MPYKNTHQTFLDRMNVVESGCWEWQHSKDARGYGKFNIYGVYWRTHRYSYQYYKGDVNGYSVLHKCDNPCCCNPEHLFLGSPTDNMLDMIRKGRGGRTKLSVETVFKIREMAKAGVTRCEISETLGIKQRTVDNVLYKKRWAHLTDENKESYKL